MFEAARIRLTAYYTGVLAAILLVLGIGAYVLLARSIDREIDDSLDRALAQLLRAPVREVIAEGVPRGRRFAPETESEVLSTDVFYVLVGPAGNVLANPSRLEEEELPLAELAEHPGSARDVSVDGARYRLKSAAASTPLGEITFVAGRSLEARDFQLRRLALTFALAGGAGLLLSAAGGFWLAGRALVPIRRTLESQRRFISDASHELRTPVAVIKANAELLLRHPNQTIEENIDQVAALADEATQLSRLVDDLLTLARADEDRLPLKRETFELRPFLEELLRDREAIAAARGVDIAAEAEPGSITADRTRLRQLVAILLDNALKYTPRGGRVRVRAQREGGRWVVDVDDSGPGIPPELRERVFERFYRGPEARALPGTGLGLAIAKSIAEAHRGRIEVRESPEGGARFEVTLPAA
ncbi:Sensor histidine kinase ResE [bacterium HR29]|nr:Sensor histidine kinase ResE [bacterium HR29]